MDFLTEGTRKKKKKQKDDRRQLKPGYRVTSGCKASKACNINILYIHSIPHLLGCKHDRGENKYISKKQERRKGRERKEKKGVDTRSMHGQCRDLPSNGKHQQEKYSPCDDMHACVYVAIRPSHIPLPLGQINLPLQSSEPFG